MAAQPQQNIRAFLNSSVKRAFAEAKVLIATPVKIITKILTFF